MSKRTFNNGVKAAWSVIKTLKLAETFSNPVSLVPSDEFKDMALDGNTNYEELYLCGLRNSDYNILLNDISFFQFSQVGEDDLRFAFYPNPFVGAAVDKIAELKELKEFLDEGIIEIEEYLSKIAEVRSSHHPPMTRYEFAPQQYVELNHPCSHLHLGHHSNNRWPVSRVMSINLFTLMIMKHYYFLNWNACGVLSVNGERVELDQVYSDAKINSSIVPPNFFTQKEACQLHWG